MKSHDEKFIESRVAKALESQFEIYSWEDMIDDCLLTEEEEAWAKHNLSYKVVRIK